MASEVPSLAVLGAGIFVKDQYVGILKNLTDFVSVRYIWSRSEGPAGEVVDLVKEWSPVVEAVFGEDGLQKILKDTAVQAVAVVLPPQVQPSIVERALQAGKHVIQEKPIAATVEEGQRVLAVHKALAAGNGGRAPIWAVAENYRFEPGFIEAARMVREAGQMMMVEVMIEAPMTATSPYFHSQWRRDADFAGAFLVDGGVHFVAALRMLAGCEVTSVCALTTHMSEALPPPDTLAAVMRFENGCTGVLSMSFAATSRKMSWRVVAARGTVEATREVRGGKAGYSATFYPSSGEVTTSFHPFYGVQAEIKAFVQDVATAVRQGGEVAADSRSSPLEALRDLATVEAMVQVGTSGTALKDVQRV
eukprot:jgi/Mesen1/2424/ME000157S01558